MVVVAILGIWASIAVPVHLEHIARGRCPQAVAQLIRLHEDAEPDDLEKRTRATGVTWFLSEAGRTHFAFSFRLNPGGLTHGDHSGFLRIDNDGRSFVVGYNTSTWANSAAGQVAARAYSWGGV